MKKLLKTMILILAIILSLGVSVFADTTEGSGDTTDEGKVDIDYNNTASGYSRYRSGYLIYITDAAGQPVSPIRLVPYSSKPSSKVRVDGLTTRVTNTLYTDIYTGTIATATNNGYNKPPLNTVSGEGYGDSFKTWLIKKNEFGDANCYTLIKNLFGDSYATAFRDEDYYLCVEAVAWLGVKSEANPKILIAGTTKTLNQIFDKLGSNYREIIRQRRLPHSGYLTQAWAGCTVPTIHQGRRESVADLTAVGNGYGIIMIRSSEVEPIEPVEPTPPVEITNDDYLKANELNFIFPDFIPSNTWGRSAEHYSSINDGKNKVNMNNPENWLHTNAEELYDQCKLRGGVWSVIEGISSDVVNFYGKENSLYYRASAGNWKKPSENKEFTESTGDIYPGYSYQYSRSIFGDDIVVCDYRGNGKSYESYITDILKMTLGHNGKVGVSSNINTEQKIPTTKSAQYDFKGKAYEEWKFNDRIFHEAEYENQLNTATGKYENVKVSDEYYEDNWKDGGSDIEQKVPVSQITYNLSHALYKYIPFDTDLVDNMYAGETAYRYTNLVGASTKVALASQLNGVLSIYPEVEYTMYVSDQKEIYTEPTETKVFCMGEKQRQCLPATLHGYKALYNFGNHMQGQSLLAAPLTGTRAFEFSKNFGDNSQKSMQVMASGSSFETATSNYAIVDMTSFSLDLYDGNLGNGFNPKIEWLSGDPVGSHDAFANAIYDNLDTEVKMKRFTSVSANSQFGEAYDMSFDYNKTLLDTHSYQIRLEYKDGRIVKGKDEVIKAIQNAYGVSESDATVIFSNWGIETQLDTMLESSTDNNNYSGVAGITESKWYDEESIAFAITVSNSSIKVGDIIFDDKSDYGSSTSQSATDISSVGRNGVQARFYFTLKFINPSINIDGFDFDFTDKMYLIKEDEIQGTRFLISNATTNDWLY